MSYKIGQIRRGNLDSNALASTIELTSTFCSCKNTYNRTNPFQDFCLKTVNSSFYKGNIYYLRFGIGQIFDGYYYNYLYNTISSHNIPDADTMRITLYLKQGNTNEDEDPPQEIDSFELNKQPIQYSLASSVISYGSSDPTYPNSTFYIINQPLNYQIESFIFTPDKDYDTIIFRIQRNSYDALIGTDYTVQNIKYDGRRWLLNDGIDTKRETVGGYTGRILKITENNYVMINSSFSPPTVRFEGQLTFDQGNYQLGCAQLKNIAPEVTTPWLKMGYQCRPGSLIVVNGEPIRIGRSGIYELNNGTEISTVMIPTLKDSQSVDAFLLDYAYEETKGGN